MRDDDRGAIGEGDNTELESGGFWRIAGVDRANPGLRQAGEERSQGSAFCGLAQELAAILFR